MDRNWLFITSWTETEPLVISEVMADSGRNETQKPSKEGGNPQKASGSLRPRGQVSPGLGQSRGESCLSPFLVLPLMHDGRSPKFTSHNKHFSFMQTPITWFCFLFFYNLGQFLYCKSLIVREILFTINSAFKWDNFHDSLIMIERF